MAWTDERVELLKQFWAEGLSASQIASKLGGVTRNAVIGKVHRLGLSGRAAPAVPSRARFDAIIPSGDDAASVDYDVAPDIDPVDPAVFDHGERATVATMQKNMCKWPIGDPIEDDFHFCGQGTGPGKAYCAYHAAIAFQPATGGRRAEERRAALPPRQRAAG